MDFYTCCKNDQLTTIADEIPDKIVDDYITLAYRNRNMFSDTILSFLYIHSANSLGPRVSERYLSFVSL